MEKSLSSVLIVDDTPFNIDVLLGALDADYDIIVATDGPSALEILHETLPDLILLDVMMPGMNGFDVLARLKADPKTASIPVIMITALADADNKIKGLSLGAVDYISKPFNVEEVKVRVKNHLNLVIARRELEELNRVLEEKVRLRTLHIKLTQETTIETLSALAEHRDPETGAHIRRTKTYVLTLAEALKSHEEYKQTLTADYIEKLVISAPLHDVGKVAVPDHILLKPGKLTFDEFEVMKKHTTIGYEALKVAERRLGQDSFLKVAAEIAYTHHEKWNGAGYPQGLTGKNIPVSGRLMALADVYDALATKRPYKLPFPHEKTVEIIKEGRGSHFDPEIVDIFLELHEEFHNIAMKYVEDDENAFPYIKKDV